MLDLLAKIFLTLSHEAVIIPLLVGGYIWLDQKLFFHAICLLLTSILFNFSLKITFQVPLLPSLGKQGFAFPSGHMQSSAILYGWLILKTRSPFLKALMGLGLLGIGVSLFYFKYHTYMDILGGIFFAILLLLAYEFLTSYGKKNIAWTIFSISTLLMGYIAMRHEVMEHVWMAYYTLLGLLCAEALVPKPFFVKNLQIKLLATALYSLTFFFLKIISATQIVSSLPLPIGQTQWFLIGFFLPVSLFFPHLFRRSRNARRDI